MNKVLSYFLALVVIGALPLEAFAATMNVSPSSTTVHAGDIVTVRLLANTQGTAINQGEATLRFPTDMLDVVSASKTGSIFTLWVEEPTYSNTAGTVKFDGGLPTPGYNGTSGTLLSITFHAKKSGTATLTLADAALRANDGLGTDVLTAPGTGTITISEATVVKPAPTAPTSSGGGVLDLNSPTHENQHAWYQNNSPLMTWKLPAGATAVQTIVDRSADATPSVTYKPAITEKRISNLDDGVWYFNIRAQVGGAWSATTRYRLQIDSEPPTLTNATFTYDSANRTLLISGVSTTDTPNRVLIVSDVAANDSVSGVDHFELTVDGSKPTIITTEELSSGHFAYSYSKSGSHSATLSAYDKAGNHSEASGTFIVPTPLAGQTLFNIGNFSVTFLTFVILILLISFASLAAAITAWYKLYTLTTGNKTRIEKRDKLLHRSLRIYKEELERHLRTLERAGSKRDLTDEEADINEDLKKNVDDLERYLAKEFKKYD